MCFCEFGQQIVPQLLWFAAVAFHRFRAMIPHMMGKPAHAYGRFEMNPKFSIFEIRVVVFGRAKAAVQDGNRGSREVRVSPPSIRFGAQGRYGWPFFRRCTFRR